MTSDYRNYQLNKENGRRGKQDFRIDHKLLFHVISGPAKGATPTPTTTTKHKLLSNQ